VSSKTVSYTMNGATFGSALAMAISFTTNKSILWAILHGLFSWLYVIYFALGGGR
jgi:hypothetical protein